MPGVKRSMDFETAFGSYVTRYAERDHHLSSEAIQGLKEKFDELRSVGVNGVQYVHRKNTWEAIVNRVAYTTLEEYFLLRALKTVGHLYHRSGRSDSSYEIYVLALGFYNHHPHYNNIRKLKLKIAESLTVTKNYERLVKELKVEAKHKNYNLSKDAIVTLSIRYAYGNALVHLGRRMEAVPYLCQDYFGIMDQENRMNMNVLQKTFDLVLLELQKGEVEFAMKMHRRLSSIMERRIHKKDCPLQFFQFFGCFLRAMYSQEEKDKLVEVLDGAAEVHSVLLTPQSLLLMAMVGCMSMDSSSLFYGWGMEIVMNTHGKMLAKAEDQDSFALRNLEVTIRIIRACGDKELALSTLSDTRVRLEATLGPGHQLVLFCRDALVRLTVEEGVPVGE